MATAKRNYFPDLASNVIRPALVEAMLLTEKHAGDAVYMATLAEELRNVEAKIAAMEEANQFGLSVVATPEWACACDRTQSRRQLDTHQVARIGCSSSPGRAIVHKVVGRLHCHVC